MTPRHGDRKVAPMLGGRTVLAITGGDRVKFLQGLVTNDMAGLKNGLVYAALLSPQGKYLFDFFLFGRNETVFLDVDTESAPALAVRLGLYRLRADVAIAESDLGVSRGLGPSPQAAYDDPRHASLGWRCYGVKTADGAIDWDAIRVANLIPETGKELINNESYILEMGFERLNGVDFRKGCYVGQEVTARMKHKTALRKGLARVSLVGAARAGDAITRDGKAIGMLHTRAGDLALAYLRFDQAGPDMQAAAARVSWTPPPVT